MTVWTLAFALVLTLVAVDAHVCMLQPMQRGGVTAAINTAAAPECAWLSGPCGNTTWHAPSLQIRPVSPLWIVFQKNLDHYNAAKPGAFVIDYTIKKDPVEADFRQLDSITDSATPSGFIYSIKVRLPIRRNETESVIRVRYVTNNPNAPPAFYQCASVSIF